MDPVSHAALGASLAAALAPSHQRRLAVLVGASAALLPDADVLIQSDADPLLTLDFHRHFTHALLFIPAGALMAALLFLCLPGHRPGFGALYRYSLAGIGLAALLDACTSYGTHLLLPFSEARVAWNIVSVFDPLFTALLLIPLAVTLRYPDRAATRLGLGLAAAYLALGFVQQQRIYAAAEAVIAQRGHAASRLTVKPTFGNQWLWRTLYEHDGHVQADAYHAGWPVRHYPGARAPLLRTEGPAARAEAIRRFRRFSDDWLIEGAPDFIGDARYAMLPTALAPIWGLRWSADGTLAFVSEHRMTAEDRQRYLRMLFGQ